MTLLSTFFFQAEDGIRDTSVTGVQTCALPISQRSRTRAGRRRRGPSDCHEAAPARRQRDRRPGAQRRHPRRPTREERQARESEERRVGKEGRGRGGAGDGERRVVEGGWGDTW